MERIILVDLNDNPVGIEEKLKAHREGKLHRAFSIFIFDPKREKILLQKRHKDKYHSGGLWANTCCSHQRPNESLREAAHRRLKEEMGFDCKLQYFFSFIYRADFGQIKEFEIDHIFVGCFQGEVKPNPKEVEDFKWVKIEDVLKDLKEQPEKYTVWFRLSFGKVVNLLKNLSLNFEEYQKLSRKTAIYPGRDKNFIFPALGLAGETGEVIERIKKVIRDKKKIEEKDKEEIKKELGDVLWYLSQLASELNLSLEEIAQENLKKIAEKFNKNIK